MATSRDRVGVAATSVELERSALARGQLPGVCVKHGTQDIEFVEVRLSHLPPWTYLLLLAGVVPFLVALAFGRTTVRAELPFSSQAREERRRLTGFAVAAFLAAGGGIAGSFAGVQHAEVLASTGMVVAGGLLFLRAVRWLHVRTLYGGARVRLQGVHTAFAMAVQQQARTR